MESCKLSVGMKYHDYCQKYCIIYDIRYEISIQDEIFLQLLWDWVGNPGNLLPQTLKILEKLLIQR